MTTATSQKVSNKVSVLVRKKQKQKNTKELFIVSTVVWVYSSLPLVNYTHPLRTLDELIDLPPQLLFTQLILPCTCVLSIPNFLIP